MADGPDNRHTPRSAGLRRDMDLLGALAERGGSAGLGTSELAERTGRQQSQVSRALAALADEGLVEREPGSRRYALGWRLFALAARTAEARLVDRAALVLRALANDLGENAHLCRLHGSTVATLLTAEPGGGIPDVHWDIADVPIAITSAGRVLLAEHTADEVAALLREAGAPATQLTSVMRRIGQAARIGYAIVDREFSATLAGASAPVRDFRGAVVAAINVSGSATALGGRLDGIGLATATAATRLSEKLGYGGNKSPTLS
ncbi:IclR family transcriptional regulator [Tamaricihabitans halophyticus]|uniref:IclR family transcriptional regulator n=1 Tax=Tamaricihabitans halophyticus TaxID=1262583 RepID=A0A4R2QFN4_9PSEU|nr:IclR family transcriptional regulator C-terminal domain-containing protein [Tamaricihabitans halophyticus]TCP47953.1 IclR family transcriptional regulator [Tamaricihabitans halophyticus]